MCIPREESKGEKKWWVVEIIVRIEIEKNTSSCSDTYKELFFPPETLHVIGMLSGRIKKQVSYNLYFCGVRRQRS